MAFVSVDDFRTELTASVRTEKGRWGAGLTGLGAVLGGAALATGHTQPVAVGVGLLLIGLAWLAPYATRLRPARSGPPIDPDSEIAQVEAACLNGVAIAFEQVEEAKAEFQREIGEQRQKMDEFLGRFSSHAGFMSAEAERLRANS